MPAILLDKSFNPWDEIQRFQSAHLQSGHYGATASFVGTMRDFNINEPISHMRLEHYPAMTLGLEPTQLTAAQSNLPHQQ